jgi:hypothetical protein
VTLLHDFCAYFTPVSLSFDYSLPWSHAVLTFQCRVWNFSVSLLLSPARRCPLFSLTSHFPYRRTCEALLARVYLRKTSRAGDFKDGTNGVCGPSTLHEPGKTSRASLSGCYGYNHIKAIVVFICKRELLYPTLSTTGQLNEEFPKV